eukprot:c9929_g1_i3.p1 GENE.c9929_g1_i3~~c9929_g1_i3.p1  ORF type:complete len:111 (-),score=17.93 c9929_g1_i3:7-339(-)
MKVDDLSDFGSTSMMLKKNSSHQKVNSITVAKWTMKALQKPNLVKEKTKIFDPDQINSKISNDLNKIKSNLSDEPTNGFGEDIESCLSYLDARLAQLHKILEDEIQNFDM